MINRPPSDKTDNSKPQSGFFGKIRERLVGFFGNEASTLPEKVAQDTVASTPETVQPSQHGLDEDLGRTDQDPISFSGLSNLTVLLVEDVDANRRAIRAMLDDLDYRTLEAQDGSEAIAQAETVRPDVILMDLSLPLMDGRKAAGWLRRHHDNTLSEIPIIAMSNQLMIPGQDLAQTEIFTEWLTKPFDREMLFAAVQSAMVGGAFVTSQSQDPAEEEQWPLLDKGVVAQDIQQVGCEKVRVWIDDFTSEAPALIQSLHNAPDASTVCITAEKLKHRADNLGLLRLRQAALSIEKGESTTGLERVFRESLRAIKTLRSEL